MGVKAIKGSTSPTVEEVARRTTLRPSEVAALNTVQPMVYAALAAYVYQALNAPGEVVATLPEGWKPFMTCADINLDREGYYAVAFVNTSAKHCIIAQRGTSEVLGLRAGVWMYFEEPTIQFYLAEQFSRHVRLSLSVHFQDEAGTWFVSYAGHSLGAVIAANRASDEDTYAVTFEAPGCRTFLQKTGRHVNHQIDSAVVTYLRAPNPINTLKPHCGYVIMMPTLETIIPSTFRLTSQPVPQSQADVLNSSSPSLAASQPLKETKVEPIDGEKKQGASVPAVGEGKAKNMKHAQSSKSPPSPVSPNTVSSSATTVSAAGTSSASASSSVKNILSAARLKLPSLRPQEYIRGYVLGGVGMGVPELQQYVSKIEPVVREMIEHTYQVHSIQGIYEYFNKEGGDPVGDEVRCWPAHLMQFIEYYNTSRALEDPDNQQPHINAAYKSMLNRLYYTEPRDRTKISVKYIHSNSLRLISAWWRFDTAQRRSLPLSLLDHKALNVIRIVDDNLTSSVLTAFQAKQYLMMLSSRPAIRDMLSRLSEHEHTVPASKL